MKDSVIKGPHSRRGKPFHGGSKTKLFQVWNMMLTRCNPSHADKYIYYAGRGIRVCEEWKDFSVFREWSLSNGYSQGLSIDRIDTNGDYEPNNCRWATPSQQSRNTRKNRMITFSGETKCVADWAKEIGVPYNRVLWRLNSGKSVDDILSQKKNVAPIHIRCVETGEIFDSAESAARKYKRSGCSILRAARTDGKCAGYHWEIL